MLVEWVGANVGDLGMVLISTVITYAAILCFTRIAGLRSFSKMSAADFAMTVAVGSLFASTISSAKPPLVVGLFALAMLFAGQWLVAYLRRVTRRARWLVDNQPLLLMNGARILEDNLARANVTRSDLYAKLREANALSLDQIRAVVFETTGDISVLHSSDPDTQLDPTLLEGVAGADRIAVSAGERRFGK